MASVQATLAVRTLEGLYHDLDCVHPDDEEAYRRALAAYLKRKADYDARMQEWRAKLAKYVETNGESKFPYAPTDLPPPWHDSLQPPPRPRLGKRKSRDLLIIWSVALEVSTPILSAALLPRDFQEGTTVISGPCCHGG